MERNNKILKVGLSKNQRIFALRFEEEMWDERTKAHSEYERARWDQIIQDRMIERGKGSAEVIHNGDAYKYNASVISQKWG